MCEAARVIDENGNVIDMAPPKAEEPEAADDSEAAENPVEADKTE